MSKKRNIFDLMMGMFGRLQDANKAHLRCISDFQELISDFIEYDFDEYQRPKYYADCLGEGDIPPVNPLTANLAPELASAVLLLQEELKNQRKTLAASQRIMDIYADHLHIALQNCENCASCGKLCASSLLRLEPVENGTKMVCQNCYDEEYFDCHKCKRILPSSEIGVDDGWAGYGYICKDCIKPVGFPQEVVIAPDFEGCEDVAAADLGALCEYSLHATGWREPNISDTIDLKFVERSGSYAVYRSESGLKCEVGELDWLGIGSLYIYEEQREDDSDA